MVLLDNDDDDDDDDDCVGGDGLLNSCCCMARLTSAVALRSCACCGVGCLLFEIKAARCLACCFAW